MIRLRAARAEECESLSALCLRSKALWGYDPAFIEQCRAELTLRPAELGATRVCVAETDGLVLGVAQISVTGEDADLLKLFVEPGHVRSGAGRLLFQWAAATARELGAARMVIEADPDA